MLGCFVIMCRIGLCWKFCFDRFVRAIFLRFRDTNDNGWLWFRFCSCDAVGVVIKLFCES